MPYCNSCGTQYETGESRCGRCGANVPVLPASVPKVIGSSMKKTTVGRRFVAGLIDLALALLMFAALFFSRRTLMLIIFRRSLALTIPHGYLLIKDSIEGKSIGKLLTGVLVIDE